MKFLLLLVLVSCASVPRQDKSLVKVGITSIKVVDSTSRNVFVSTGMNEVENDNQLFKIYASVVYEALKGRGYVPVSSKDKANLIVYLSYEVSDPENYTHTQSVPVYGGNSTSTVTNQFGQQIGTIRTQNYGPTGYREVKSSYSIYSKKITLHAYEGEQMVWATSLAHHSSSSTDLFKLFPYMVQAGAPYFDKHLDDAPIVEVVKMRAPASVP